MRPERAPRVNINGRIRAPQVRVIDEDGSMLGVMTPIKGIEIARGKGLDLDTRRARYLRRHQPSDAALEPRRRRVAGHCADSEHRNDRPHETHHGLGTRDLSRREARRGNEQQPYER